MAIITQYYRNVNNKIQKTEIAMEYRYRNTPQKLANIKNSPPHSAMLWAEGEPCLE